MEDSPDSIVADGIIDQTELSLEINVLLVKEATVVNLSVKDIDFNVLDEYKDSKSLNNSEVEDISWEDDVGMIKEERFEFNFINSGSLIEKSSAGVDTLVNLKCVDGCSVFDNGRAREGMGIMVEYVGNVKVLNPAVDNPDTDV